MCEEIILKTKVSEKIVLFIITMFFLSIGIYFWRNQSISSIGGMFSILIFVLTAVYCAFSLLESCSVVILRDEVLLFKRKFHEDLIINLSEISGVRHSYMRNKFILLNTHGDQIIGINESIPLFPKFFENLRKKRIDLWPFSQATSFWKKTSQLFILLFYVLLPAFCIVFISIYDTLPLDITVLYLITIPIFIYLTRDIVIGLKTDIDSLVVFFFFRKRQLMFQEIGNIFLTLPGEFQSSHYVLTIQSTDGKGYLIYGFGIHEILIYDKLKSLMHDKVKRANKSIKELLKNSKIEKERK